MTKQVPAPQKEPLFFHPGSRAFFGILSVLSLGYFLGVFIGSLRRAQKTSAYLITLLLGLWMISFFDLGTQGYFIFAIVVILQASFTRFIVPTAIENSVAYQLVTGVNMSTPFHIEAADGSGTAMQYLFKAKTKVTAIQQAQVARTADLSRFYNEMEKYESNFPKIEFSTDTDAEITLYTSDDCTLAEPRKGPTVTERETSTGIRPFVGTKVGPFLVGGAGPQKSHSTSVTTKGEDVVTEVDSGHVVVTTRGVSFVGDKYTRHSEFKTIIANEGDGNRLTISDSKRTTVWTIIFPDDASMWIVAALIDAATSLSERRLDTSGKATVEDVKKTIDENQKAILKQLTDAYQDAYEQFEAVNDQLREYHRVYPNQVVDPGPRKSVSPTATSS